MPADLNSDAKSKLKVYKGTTLISEQGLPGYPTAIQTLYVDENEPKIPSESFIFVPTNQQNISIHAIGFLFDS